MEIDMQSFKRELALRKEYIDECLENYLRNINAFPPLIHQAMHYAVFNGGKRLRPMFVMEGARLAGREREIVVPTACALEMIHSYSLVHDDLPAMDDDDYRRGKLTCHRVYGEANAILTGDALLTMAFQLLAQNAAVPGIDPARVLRVIEEVALAAGSQGMIGGQVLDLQYEGKSVEFKSLEIMHKLKTGQLFRASLRSGALLAGMDETGLAALDIFAEQFGLAFQITDDILDIRGDEKTLGKPVGSDEKNMKTTYPSLFGLEGAEKMAVESIEICMESMKEFGEQGLFLQELALYLLKRDS